MDSKLPTAGSGRLMAVHFLLLILPRIPAKGMGPPIVGRSSTSVTLMGINHQHPVPAIHSLLYFFFRERNMGTGSPPG